MSGQQLEEPRAPHDFPGDLVQRHNLISASGLRHATGHAPNHATQFVLYHHIATLFADQFAPAQTVLAHAGHDDAEDFSAIDGNRAAKQHIRRRAAGIFRGLLLQMQHHPGSGAPDLHVFAPGRKVGVSGLDGRAFGAFMKFHGTELVEASGEHGGKQWRHVLHDQERQMKPTRKTPEKFGQRIGTAGGGGDTYDLRQVRGLPAGLVKRARFPVRPPQRVPKPRRRRIFLRRQSRSSEVVSAFRVNSNSPCRPARRSFRDSAAFP